MQGGIPIAQMPTANKNKNKKTQETANKTAILQEMSAGYMFFLVGQ